MQEKPPSMKPALAHEAAIPITFPHCEELANYHYFSGECITVTCHECGRQLLFKYSMRTRALLLFALPCDCGQSEKKAGLFGRKGGAME